MNGGVGECNGGVDHDVAVRLQYTIGGGVR